MRLVIFAVVALSGCRTVPKTPDAPLKALASLHDGYLSGTPVALGPAQVLNREDFVYDAKFSPDSKTVALSRLGMKSFDLTLFELGAASPAKARIEVAINPIEFDVDALEFSPDGQQVATVSRDGALRVYSAQTGALRAAWLTEEPLLSLAFDPNGQWLALGSARGLVTILSAQTLGYVAESRAHTDEVRALAFTPRGELLSAGWDKRLRTFALEDVKSPHGEVRTHVTKKNGQVLFRAAIDRAASVTVALDERMPMVVIRGAVAQAIGLDVSRLVDTVMIPTAFGNQLAKVAKGRELAVKALTLHEVDVAICDACVPAEAQAVWGGPLLKQLRVAFDESSGEMVFTAPPGVMQTSQALVPLRDFSFPAAINDVSVDAQGAVAGVAFSETKAQRTKAVYDREKRREVEPERAWDCGARVDLNSGQVLEKKTGHRGVVASAAISPDGKTLATGGWDKRVLLHGEETVVSDDYGWAIRRVRFSRDARRLLVAAWTPQNPLGNHQSDPAAVVYEVLYGEAEAVGRPSETR